MFSYFFDVFGPRDHVQGLLQALKFNFPSKMLDLDAYVSSYCLFRRFRRFWKVANPFLMIWGSFSLIFSPGKGPLLLLERVLCLGFGLEGYLCGKAKLSSRDQVGC